ncbi:MAG: hypothetical protein SVR94_15990 [Pseudomonadota bacterium]|nr:hypothetical protein [Pseudomonadota bacterium]
MHLEIEGQVGVLRTDEAMEPEEWFSKWNLTGLNFRSGLMAPAMSN